MTTSPPNPAAALPAATHWRSYPRFLWNALLDSVEGNWVFYVWMTVLTAIFLVGANAWAVQVRDGMQVTNMSDHVSWGLYIANFTFLVGLAAGGVMMVIPAYLYHDEEMHDLTLIGELLAIAALIMALMFVVCDLGRPDRFWHLLPGLGRFNFPVSMLTWDVIVLNGYLMLNLHICGYLLYMRFIGDDRIRNGMCRSCFFPSSGRFRFTRSPRSFTAVWAADPFGTPPCSRRVSSPQHLCPGRRSSSWRYKSCAARWDHTSAMARFGPW
jgi:Ni/Fe-hydrogenase subunit HybB-like protein